MTLKEEIEVAGLTRAQAAKVIGVPLTTLNDWLRGDRPKMDKAIYAMDRIRDFHSL